jgi:anti-anti-sigma factor
MHPLKIELDRQGLSQDIRVIRIYGLIDTNTAGEVGSCLQKVVKEPCFKIIFDLANVSYISSAGWGIFIGEIRNVRDHQGDIKLAAMLPDVEEIFKVLEFDSILKSYPAVAEATAAFSQHV